MADGTSPIPHCDLASEAKTRDSRIQAPRLERRRIVAHITCFFYDTATTTFQPIDHDPARLGYTFHSYTRQHTNEDHKSLYTRQLVKKQQNWRTDLFPPKEKRPTRQKTSIIRKTRKTRNLPRLSFTPHGGSAAMIQQLKPSFCIFFKIVAFSATHAFLRNTRHPK